MNMKRRDLLGLLLLGGPLSKTIGAFQQPAGRGGPPGPPTVEAEKLSDTLVLLRGGGGTTAVLLRGDGVTVVDTKNPKFGAPIMAAVKDLTGRPITTIINTHCHGDHVSGNVEFPAIEVIAHENTAANMKNWKPVAGFPVPATPQPSIFEQNANRNLPTRTFGDRLTLGKGPDQVELYYFGRGHTNGDAWILFPSQRVVHAGDIFAWNNQIPILDSNNGASGVSYPDTLMKAHAALSKSADRIITGHSTVMTFNDLRAFADFNRSFLDAARAAKKKGQTVDDFVKSWTPPAGINPPTGARLPTNAQAIYNEIG
jgi:glyoxylase-like metal-dependent hydrolase (beta-lactamase superfamily II)